MRQSVAIISVTWLSKQVCKAMTGWTVYLCVRPNSSDDVSLRFDTFSLDIPCITFERSCLLPDGRKSSDASLEANSLAQQCALVLTFPPLISPLSCTHFLPYRYLRRRLYLFCVGSELLLHSRAFFLLSIPLGCVARLKKFCNSSRNFLPRCQTASLVSAFSPS